MRTGTPRVRPPVRTQLPSIASGGTRKSSHMAGQRWHIAREHLWAPNRVRGIRNCTDRYRCGTCFFVWVRVRLFLFAPHDADCAAELWPPRNASGGIAQTNASGSHRRSFSTANRFSHRGRGICTFWSKLDRRESSFQSCGSQRHRRGKDTGTDPLQPRLAGGAFCRLPGIVRRTSPPRVLTGINFGLLGGGRVAAPPRTWNDWRVFRRA